MSSDFNLNVFKSWLFLLAVFVTKNRKLFGRETWAIKRDSHE